MPKPLFRFVAAPKGEPCSSCDGSGSEWKRRADGELDRRYRFPIGPCSACGGSGRRRVAV